MAFAMHFNLEAYRPSGLTFIPHTMSLYKRKRLTSNPHTPYLRSGGTTILNLIVKGADSDFLNHAPTSPWNVHVPPGTTTLKHGPFV